MCMYLDWLNEFICIVIDIVIDKIVIDKTVIDNIVIDKIVIDSIVIVFVIAWIIKVLLCICILIDRIWC